MTEASLHQAVQTDRISTRQGLLQKLFAFWFDAFIYNQIWEDPRVDLDALEIDQSSRILTIASGGCNALNYLLASPASVTAVDLNRHHVHLLDLKLAALTHLPDHATFFSFFGSGKSANAVELYRRYIAGHLDQPARRFWESNSIAGRLIHGKRIAFFEKAGLYDHSRNGHFLKFFHRYARLAGCDPSAILDAKTLEEQAEIHRRAIDPFFDNFLFRMIGKLPVTMFGLGIPPQQFRELKNGLKENGSVIDVYRERVRRLACDFPIAENYFAWQAFARRYDTENRIAIPDYLKEQNYEKLKGSADRLTTRIGSITDEIRRSQTGAYNRFVFLDAQDWMDTAAMIDLWSAVAEKGEAGSRVIFRTAGAASPVESALPADLRSRFVYHAERSNSLFEKDRSSIYGGFHLYELKP